MVISGLWNKSLAQVGHKHYTVQTTAHNESEMELALAAVRVFHTQITDRWYSSVDIKDEQRQRAYSKVHMLSTEYLHGTTRITDHI
jgi:hypothetical protein